MTRVPIAACKMIAANLRRRALGIHRDTGGAMSILVLLIVWALVALIGMLYNNVEQARRRQEIQTAADAAAHGAATWMARTGNAINAQNMVICQDAATEAIWRGVEPTDRALTGRLNGEIQYAQQLKQTNELRASVRAMTDMLAQIATDEQLTSDALSNLESGAGANYADPQDQLDHVYKYRQARSVMGWIINTYVHGTAPPAAPAVSGARRRPGPPGPAGQGLDAFITQWLPIAVSDEVLDYIINFINNTEMPYVRGFEDRTAYARNQPVDKQMAAHEHEVYLNQVAMMEQVADTIEEQRVQFARAYQVDLTLATVTNSAGMPGPAHVTAPYLPASAIADWPVAVRDTIRAAYPLEALDAGLSPTVTISALNVHTDQNRIWHPDVVVDTTALQALYPTLQASYTIPADAPGGWGHVYSMPLERYVYQRVNADMRTLEIAYLSPLDRSRSVTLARALQQMLSLPVDRDTAIRPLDAVIPGDFVRPVLPPPPPAPGRPAPPLPPPVVDNFRVMPAITAPAAADAAYRQQVVLYSQNSARLVADVKRLRTEILNFTAYFRRFVVAFAAETWEGNVLGATSLVLENLSIKKEYFVLASYGLRPVPDWAQNGLYITTAAQIEDQIMQRALAQGLMQSITTSLPDTPSSSGILAAIDRAGIADAIVRPAARRIAADVAREFVNRPWPFEITPPDSPVPPFHGIGSVERKQLYTVVAAARETSAVSPRTLLPAFFRVDPTKLVTYAQGEMFNPMEFDNGYGGGERFDQVVQIPEITYRVGTARFGGVFGAPRGWRVASVGGWQWRTRLSLSDALFEALDKNDELRQYLQDAGVSNPPAGALDEINLH